MPDVTSKLTARVELLVIHNIDKLGDHPSLF